MKKEFVNQKSAIIIFSIIILFIHQLIYQKIFPTSQGFMGHDWQQNMSYFIFGKFWFEKNFLSIPWFTPAICCGLPFYADPNSMFYSIPQLIFIIFDDAIFSTKFVSVTVKTQASFKRAVKLAEIKKNRDFIDLALVKQNRLSVMEIDLKSWKKICKMGKV